MEDRTNTTSTVFSSIEKVDTLFTYSDDIEKLGFLVQRFSAFYSRLNRVVLFASAKNDLVSFYMTD